MGDLQIFENYSAATESIIEISRTNRGVEMYATMLGFPDKASFLNSLPIGSRLLDVGAGKEGLKNGLAVERPDIQVVSINPSLANSEFRKEFKTENAVIAINPELPIKNEVFDIVIDQMASIYYSQGKREEETMFRNRLLEILRILKTGGKAFVEPTFINSNNDFDGKGALGIILDEFRNIEWDKKQFVIPHVEIPGRSYHITKTIPG